jgi:hypothetical protein
MSETTRTAEATKKATDQAARSSHTGAEAVTKTAKETAEQANRVTQNTADRAREVSQSMTETVTEAANAATDMSSRAAEQGREVIMLGVRTAADVSSKVADIGFGRSHVWVSSAIQAMDIYRDASERSADRVKALFSSAMVMSRGLQNIGHAWLEMIDHTMEHAAHKPQDLLRCRNLVEVAEVQRDLYLDAINHAFESTSRLLDLAGQAAHEAVRPLRS